LEDRREVAKVTLPDRPVVRQPVADECFLLGMTKTACVGFDCHLPAKGIAAGQRTKNPRKSIDQVIDCLTLQR